MTKQPDEREQAREQLKAISPELLAKFLPLCEFIEPIGQETIDPLSHTPEQVYRHYELNGTPAERSAAHYGFTVGYAKGIRETGDSSKQIGDKRLSPDLSTLTDSAPYFTMSEIGKEFGTTAQKVLQLLVDSEILHTSSLDDAIHYRPKEYYFSLGWFYRLEKFLVKESRAYFQTVVSPKGLEPVLALIKEKLAEKQG